MKKSSIISITFSIIIILAFVFVVTNKQGAAPEQNDNEQPTANQAAGPQKEAEQKDSGQYKEYSEKALAEASGQKVLFFHAPWCPQCRSIEKTILENKNSVPAGYTVFKVDFDSTQALRQKYGVTIQTTFVKIDDSGKFIDKYVAYDEPTIQAVNKNFLLP